MDIGNNIDIKGELILSLAKESVAMLNSLEERINKILDNNKLLITLDKSISDNLNNLSESLNTLSSNNLSGVSNDLKNIFTTIQNGKDAVTILKDLRENYQKLETTVTKTNATISNNNKSKNGINSIVKSYIDAIKEFQTLNKQKINGKNVLNQQQEARNNLAKASKTYNSQISNFSTEEIDRVTKALTELKNVTLDTRNAASNKDYINQIKQQYQIQGKLSQEQLQVLNETKNAYKELTNSAKTYYNLLLKSNTSSFLPQEQKRLNALAKKYEDERQGIGIYVNGTDEQKLTLRNVIENARVNAIRKYVDDTERFLERNIYNKNRRYNENSYYQENTRTIEKAISGFEWKDEDGIRHYEIGLKDILNDANYLSEAFKENTEQASKLRNLLYEIDNAINIKGDKDKPETMGLKSLLKTPYQYDLVSSFDVSNLQRRTSEFFARNPLAYQNKNINASSLRNGILGLDINKTTEKQLNDQKTQLENFQEEVFSSGNFGSDLINGVDNFFQNTLLNFSGLFASFNFAQKIADAVQQSKELNVQLVELSKVSDTSIRSLNNQFSDFYNIAKELGGTITDTIAATADQSRNGYSLPESKELARVALLYKNIGDGIDIDSANESLISTLRGFKLEASEAESIIDKFNEVSNNFPISSAGIGEALQRSAASFNAANTSLSESIALITATNSVIQDPTVVGTLWKTVSARIRGAKMELEELGEDTDGIVKSTSKLRADVKAVTGFDIMKDENTFKSIYDIIVGIGAKWDEISDINQAALLEELAGKRSANALVAVLQNVDMLKDAYQTAENSAGSAMQEQERYQEGMEYHFNQMAIAQQNFSHTVADSESLKYFSDLATSVLNLFNNISKVVGIAPEVAVALGGIGLQFIQFKDENDKELGRGLSGYIAKIGDKLSSIRAKYNIKNIQDNPNALKEVGRLASDQIKGFFTSFTGQATMATAAWGVYSQAIKYQDEMGNVAQQLGATFKDSSDSIDYYKERIISLKDIISSNKSSFEEVAQARKDLMSVQNELIDKFGDENNAINIITESINKQTSALDRLKQKAFESKQDEYVSEQNSLPTRVQRELSYAVDPYKQFDNGRPVVINTAEEELTRNFERYTDHSLALVSTLRSYEVINSKISDRINKVFSDNNIEVSNNGKIVGNIYDYAKALKELKEVVKSNENGFENDETFIELNNEISKLSGNLNSVKNNYEELYKGFVLYNDILTDKQLTAQYDAINNAYDGYIEALDSGNQELEKEAIDNFSEKLRTAVDSNANNPRIVKFFENLYSNIQDKVGTVELKYDLQLNDDGYIQDKVKRELIRKFKNIDLSEYTSESLNSFLNLDQDSVTENEDTWIELTRLVETYQISITQLIDTFAELGLIQTEVQRQFIQLFGSEAQNALTKEEKANVSKQKNILLAAHNALIQYEKETGKEYSNVIRDGIIARSQGNNKEQDSLGEHMTNIAKIIGNMDSFDSLSKKIDTASESVSNYQDNLVGLTAAIKAQETSSSLSTTAFNKLKAAYDNIGASAGKLTDYYRLTEKGIELNVDKTRRLISLNQEKSIEKVNDAYKELVKQYNQQFYELTEYQNALINTTNSENDKRNALEQLIEEKKKDIQTTLEQKASLDILYGQLQNMTQVYSEYMDALSSPNLGSQYDAVLNSFSQIQDAVINGKFGTDDVQKFIELMTGENVEGLDRESIAKRYIDAQKIAQRYFTEGDEGLKNAYDDMTSWVGKSKSIVQEGDKFIVKDFELLAQNVGTSVDTIVLILNKMKEKGFNIEFNVEDIELKTAYEELSKLREKQIQLGGEGIDLELDKRVKELNQQIDANNIHAEVPVDVDFNVLFKEYDNIRAELVKELSKTNLSIDDIDFSQFKNLQITADTVIKDKNGNTLDKELVNKIKESYDQVQALIDSDAYGLEIKPNFTILPPDNKSKESVDGSSLAKTITDAAQEGFDNANLDIPVTVDKAGNFDEYKKSFNQTRTEMQQGIDIPVNVNIKDDDLAKLREIARYKDQPENYAGDTTSITKGAKGLASGQNNFGSSPTLVGELGPEIHVDSATGRQELLGQNGAEFVKSSRIKSNDIIFNADQTNDILSGKSYANGTNKVGNVDINARPIVENEDGSYSTTSTSWQEHQVGDEEHGHYLIGHFATIRTNGTRLTGPEVWDYAHYVLGSPDPFATDAAMDNLLYAVVDKLANGEYITDANFEQAKLEAKAQDENMHVLQDNMYRDERERLRSGQSHAIGKNNDLVGELGPEIVVHNGRWGLVGENGPVMGKGLIRPGDIVFNANQTRDLLSNGQTNSLGTSYAGGKAFNRVITATGEEPKNGPQALAAIAEAKGQKNANSATKANTTANKANTSATNANTKALNETKKEYNWMDKRFEALDHMITMSTKTAENTHFSTEKRLEAYNQANKFLVGEIESYAKAISTLGAEFDTEIAKIPQMFAGILSYDDINRLQQQFINGDVDYQHQKTVLKPTDESEAGKKAYEERNNLLDTLMDYVSTIRKYQENQVETQNKINNNVESMYSLRLAKYEELISKIDSASSEIQNSMNIAVVTGRGIISADYYEDLIDNADSKVDALESKLSILYEKLEDETPYTEAQNNVRQEIANVEQEIQNCISQQAEWNEVIKELPITYIKSYIKNLNSIANNLTNYISVLQAAGNDVTATVIKKQTELANKIANQYSNELELHQKKMNSYLAGSDKQNEEFEAIQGVEDSLANIVSQMKEYEKQVLALPVNKLSKMKDYLTEIGNALNDIQDDNLTKINAAIEIINRQAEEMIKPLQKQLDILEKQNEARKIQLDIEQAEYDLEKAKEERTIQTVNSKGELVYTADEDAIRDAQQAYEEAKYNKLVHDIQAEIDNIQEIADERTEKYEQIQKDVEYNQLVADAAKLATTTTTELIDKINTGNDSDYYEQVKKDYEATAAQIKQNEEITEDLDTIITLLERLNEQRVSGQLNESQYNVIVSDLMSRVQNGTMTSTETLSALLSANGYNNIDAVYSAVGTAVSNANYELTNSASDTNKTLKEIKAIYDKYYKSWDELLNKISSLLDQADTAYKNQKNASSYYYSSSYSSSGGGGGGRSSSYSVAGRGVDSVNHARGETSANWVTTDDVKRMASGLLNGPVISTKKDQELIQKLGIKPVDGDRVLTLLKPNELVANSEQQSQIISNMRSGLNSALGMASGASVSHQPPQVNISMGDINLPNVKDADGFAKAMLNTFELNMNQYFSRVF